ncbi:MAG: translation initiation factor [Bacteroidales bacterium]|nr:translation initiation factor [Bacteroidales bacterium]MDD4670676.1 translation initiation factor [Bacteroidales bacterium]
MSENDWKKRLGVVFSTNPNFGYESAQEQESHQTIPNDRQKLIVSIDRRNRGGRQVTLITGFIGSDEDLAQLGKSLKNKCGAGGSAKDGEIIIQGDFRDKIVELLISSGYKAKRGN